MSYFYRPSVYLILLLLFTGSLPAHAQGKTLKGKILDEITGRAVDYGLVINYSRHTNIYSNPAGEFILDVSPGDTLVLSAIGYYYQKVIVTDSLLEAALPVKMIIRPQAYEITEARIFALGTYEEFRQKFIHLHQPKSKTEVLAETLAELSHNAAKEAYDMARANRKRDGITLLSVPIRTSDEKERIALARILEKEKIRDQIYQKFNPGVVKKVTGLTEDTDIIEFMVFCEFSDEYLLGINAYDLMTEIALKYEAFKRKRHPVHSGDYPFNSYHDLSSPNA